MTTVPALITELEATLALESQATPVEWTTEAVFDSSFTAIAAPDIPGGGSPNVVATTLCDDDRESVKQAEKDAAFIAHIRNVTRERTLMLIEALKALVEISQMPLAIPMDAPNEMETAQLAITTIRNLAKP